MKKLFLLAILAFTFTFQSCRKDALTTNTFEETSQDMTTAQNFEDDTEDILDENIDFRTENSECPIKTWANPVGTYPNTITLDFGAGCVGLNGRERSGKIIINVTDSLRTVGSVKTVTFDNYFVEGVKIEGSKIWTNNGLNEISQPNFTRNADITLTFPNAETATWEANNTLTMVNGANTPYIRIDDEFEITGSASGINRKGKSFSSVTTVPVLRKKTCRYPVSGIRTITVEDKTITVDFGNGDCDNKATLTKPDGSQVETLIRRWW